ncbi:hypothetical protein BV25DRAFT_1977834 [Artomyces pyxidatus]|uniref:Uncharacterized protein n=1 Tax=Artomyces pyxidatus TaxID=48021 RepID=A0ACB8SLE6_9AGAM|nr:hypothetical protein BV25DRAFT_1977834 [Artomyces pyxidatus]
MSMQCPQCQESVHSILRCVDCFHCTPVCKQCLCTSHAAMPFHRVEEWAEPKCFWERTTLSKAGLRVELGHGGKACPVRGADGYRYMTIVHSRGIEKMDVGFCLCAAPGNSVAETEPRQLMAFGLFPASWKRPLTAFAINMFKDYKLLHLQSQITAGDFVRFLERSTDNVEPDTVANRTREFMTAYREYSYLVATKRAGVKPGKDMVAGSLAVLCPACPQPDVNMSMVWSTRGTGLMYLDALYHTIDGNFKQSQREKPLDANDFPLTEGAAYFANGSDFKLLQKRLPPHKDEVTTCHKFGAMGYGGYWGKISGTLGLFCARHMFAIPGGGVDLQKGERFANVDFAMMSGLQRWMHLRMHVSGYDINCQYRINFKPRIEWMLDHGIVGMNSIKWALFPYTVAAVGKFHLPAHMAACRFKFSFNFLRGMGMTDGEAPERNWAQLNNIGRSTREMTSGHRQDTINEHHSDINVRKVHSMAKDLAKKHEQANAQRVQVEDILVLVNTNVGDESRKAWKVELADWEEKVVDIANHEHLANPFEPDKTKGECREGVDRGDEGGCRSGAHEVSRRTRLRPRVLMKNRAELLDQMANHEVVGDGLSVVEGHRRFLDRWEEWKTLYQTYGMPLINAATTESGAGSEEPMLTTVDESELADEGAGGGNGDDDEGGEHKKMWDEVSSIVINLPSTYSPRVVGAPVLKGAVDVECELRKSQARDALDELRGHLTTAYAFKKLTEQRVTGEIHNTRANNIARRKRKNIDRAAMRYRLARKAMVRLGLDLKPKGDKGFKVLKPTDVKAFITQEDLEGMVNSKKHASWIWTDFTFLDLSTSQAVREFCEDAVKVMWFRMTALHKRWDEQGRLVNEEMCRTLRFFHVYQGFWHKRAASEEEAGRRGAAAYARKQAYRYTRLWDRAWERFKGKVALYDEDDAMMAAHAAADV